MKVAILGTGTMGAGMARAMRREGLDVAAWNRTKSKAEPLADDGVQVADSVAQAVAGVDVVLTMLFDADAVLGVTDDITGNLGAEAVWLQSATVGPDGIQRIAAAAGDGARLLDAPMLGTKEPAEQGKLVPIVSGDAQLIERARPVLDAVGTKTVVAGNRLGAASSLKLACNAWIFAITAATAQSIALAQQSGIEGGKFLEAIDGGSADSPYAHLKGKLMLSGEFPPSFGLDGGRKDLGLIQEVAKAAGVDTSFIDGTKALFDRASDDGHGEDDLAAVYTALTR
jgi:3-hydroxyisobutyrate dehydrogenase